MDHQFQLHGFAKERLFYTQGDYGLLQCSHNCHAKTYDNEMCIRDRLLPVFLGVQWLRIRWKNHWATYGVPIRHKAKEDVYKRQVK